jgi:hypothetical protein
VKIIDAATRLATQGGPKVLVAGPSGVGKTTLLKTLSPKLLGTTLFVDIEAGDLAVADVEVASIRPRTWNELRDLACILGGPNPALPAAAAYSDAHFNEAMKNPELAKLRETYTLLFIDSVTAAARLCFTWAEQQPEATSDRGRKDLRGTYGVHARGMIGLLNQFQHTRGCTVVFVCVLEKNIDEANTASWQLQIEGAKTGRELPAIVDQIVTMQWINFGDGKPAARAFCCTNPNPWGYPAKDRSGKLDQIEPPNLGALLAKLAEPGQRKPLHTMSFQQPK